jgi:hypothetical protein
MLASSTWTQASLNWTPTGPDLISDLKAMDYWAGERLAQLIEELQLQLQDQRRIAWSTRSREASVLPIYNKRSGQPELPRTDIFTE